MARYTHSLHCLLHIRKKNCGVCNSTGLYREIYNMNIYMIKIDA